MASKNSKIVACFIVIALIAHLADAQTNREDLVKMADKAIIERRKKLNSGGSYGIIEDDNGRRIVGNLSDKEKIRALAYWMEDKTGMISGAAWGPSSLLVADPDLIKDWSELKSMLGNEYDPRKFYCLSQLYSIVTDDKKIDFIPQKIHMLFRHGIPAKEGYSVEIPYIQDVSHSAYGSILSDLKSLGHPFDEKEHLPYGGNVPLKQCIPVLAKWLKANWPGCANLEIPAEVLKPKEAARRDMKSGVRSNSEESQDDSSDKPDAKVFWSWIAGGVALLMVVLAGFKLRRS